VLSKGIAVFEWRYGEGVVNRFHLVFSVPCRETFLGSKTNSSISMRIQGQGISRHTCLCHSGSVFSTDIQNVSIEVLLSFDFDIGVPDCDGESGHLDPIR